MTDIVFLNGEFIPKTEAKISVFDRGFLFADGIYEVIPVENGQKIQEHLHLKRMQRSLDAIYLTNPYTHKQWQKIIDQLIEKNNLHTGFYSIYLQITRGEQERRDHAIPDKSTPTIVGFSQQYACKTPHFTQGFHAITQEDKRRKDCWIKAISLLPNILMAYNAKKAGVSHTILIRDGSAIESTSSNLFIVEKGTLITPPLTPHILPGVTRQTILHIAEQLDIPAKEESIDTNKLAHADEIWLTGSISEIAPIISLDKKPVGRGEIGPMWHKLNAAYQKLKKKPLTIRRQICQT